MRCLAGDPARSIRIFPVWGVEGVERKLSIGSVTKWIVIMKYHMRGHCWDAIEWEGCSRSLRSQCRAGGASQVYY